MGPKIGNDTRHVNSGQSVDGPDIEASKIPLAQWAASLSGLGVKQVRLGSRRDQADKGLTEWMWPAAPVPTPGGDKDIPAAAHMRAYI